MRERSIEGAASWTVASFGAMALVSGAVGIVWPEATLALLGCETKPARPDGDHTLSFAIASSMAALNMGAYYLLAARANWRAFYRWTVPFRCVTVWVFTIAVLLERAPIGFLGVAAWELVGAIATAVALRWDRRR
jgi:hypothetical protein